MPDLAMVKSWLGITEEAAELGLPDTTWDTELGELLGRTVDFIQRELDWYFGAPRAAVEVLNGPGLRGLWLRQYIVGTTLTVQERYGVGDTWTAVPVADYEFEAGGRGIFNVANWTHGFRNYRVSYSEGFATWPGDAEQLVLDLVASRWKGRENDGAMKSETIGDYSYTRADLEEMPGWGAVWAHWKRGRI